MGKVKRMVKVMCLMSLLVLLMIGFTTKWMVSTRNRASLHQDDNVALLVLIHASAKPEGQVRRDIIRKTWVSSAVMEDIEQKFKKKVTYKFVLGGRNLTRETKASVAPEASQYGDMIFLNQVTDEHETLTQRTLKSFEYVLSKNYGFSYLLKCDDDTFVDIKAVVESLRDMKWLQLLYWGEFVGGYSVLDEGIYAEHDWFICDKYVPYAFGGGYVLSRDLVELVSQNSPYLQHYMNEDVSLASWLSPFNIVRVHDQKFDTGSDSKGCMKPFIVAHKVPSEKMLKYYKSLRREGRMCGRRTKTRKHWSRHMYDWGKPPTQCCDRPTL